MVNKIGPETLVAVTGAGSGIGRATAAAFAARGATVICADIDVEAAEKTSGLCVEAGGTGRAERCDVTDAAALLPYPLAIRASSACTRSASQQGRAWQGACS